MRVRLSKLAAFLFVLAACLFTAPAQARQLDIVTPKLKCEALQDRIFHLGADLAKITAAKLDAAPVSNPTCEVRGYVTPQVQFSVRLPLANWHQRMAFFGCGGFCGTVGSGRMWAVDGCAPVDEGEFAVVYSDMGHAGSHADGVWASNNPQALRDFGSRGVHVSTLAAREIIKAFYGQQPRYSYFTGCSDGGREALMEAQRYPKDFDGIVAGAPALNMTANNSIYHAWMVQHLLSPDAKPLIGNDQLAAVHAAVMGQCDMLDREQDGIIANPTLCHPKLENLSCLFNKSPNCLTPDQIRTVYALYAGPTDARGRRLYHGVTPGSEKMWNPAVPNSVSFAMNFTSFWTGAAVPVEQNVWKLGFDAAAIQRYNRFATTLNATDTNLSAFQAGGGKLLMWHGWADTSIPPGSTTSYAAAVRARLGAATSDRFLRLFMIPGMGHCTGGDGPTRVDFLTPLMSWVEDGQAPDMVTAAIPNNPQRGWALRPYLGG